MFWSDFYDRHWDWEDSTKRTRISSLEDIGSGDEIVEVIQEIFDPKVTAQLIRKAMKLGAEFTVDNLLEIDGEIPPELFRELVAYSGLENEIVYLDEETEQMDAERNPTKPKRGSGTGLLAVLASLFSGSGNKTSGHRHSRGCTGNCASCPPHYGYRYGRWYYGHGHQRGCELGGNGGASGRTSRD